MPASYSARGATVRAAVPADAAALGALASDLSVDTFVRGFKLGYSEADLAEFLASSYAPEAALRWIADPDGLVLVAEDAAGALVGYAYAGNNSLPLESARAGDGELKKIYVHGDWRGSGLGKRLMDDVDAFFGARAYYIGVWSGNLLAQNFYARWGFKIVGRYDIAVGATIDDERIMGR
jgi:ribosomal protein S18 acetylase RimI-like enzyme